MVFGKKKGGLFGFLKKDPTNPRVVSGELNSPGDGRAQNPGAESGPGARGDVARAALRPDQGLRVPGLGWERGDQHERMAVYLGDRLGYTNYRMILSGEDLGRISAEIG